MKENKREDGVFSMKGMVYGCQWTNEGAEKHRLKMNEIISHWNTREGIQSLHGPASLSNSEFSGSYKFIDTLLKSRVDQKHNFHPDFLLSDKVMNRLKAEIDIYDRRIRIKGFVNPLENIVGVPHEIVKRSPISYKAYNDIDQIVSYERTQLGKMSNYNNTVPGYLLLAYKTAADNGLLGPGGVKEVRNLKRLESSILRSPNKANRAAHELAIEKLLNLDKENNPTEAGEGSIMRDFRLGVEMSDRQWKRARKGYDPALQKAIGDTKKFYREMSGVLINGLGTLEKNYLLRKHGTESKSSAAVKADNKTQYFLDSLNDSIKAIQKKTKDGSYYPQYVLKDLPLLKASLDNMSYFGNEVKFNEASDMAADILHDMATPVSQRAKQRGQLDWTWHNDPIMVSQMYGYDVVGFNKQNRLQNTYIKFLRDIPKDPKVSADFVHGMTKYMDDIYTMATRGYKDRPQWVNNTIGLLGAATVVRTMGYGFTGSIRNVLSILQYHSYFGRKVLKDAKAIYETDNKWEYSEDGRKSESVGAVTKRVEQESGFLFGEGGKDMATELFTQGLLPVEGVKEKSVSFDPLTGEILYETNKGIMRKLAPASDWTVNKTLVFHRWTENWTRKWIFRTAFINKFQTDMAQSKYAESVTKNNPKKIERDAVNFAINAVNAWAYEYAGHAKSKFIRGVPGQLDSNGNLINTGKVFMGAASQSMNMLMHYPHSLIGTQIRMLRGAGMSVKAGDYMSPEMMYLMRYAGVYAAIQLGSVVTNLDLNNLAENDTIEKIKQMKASITEYDSDDKITRGVVANWLGPMADDLRYVLEVSGIKNAKRSDIEQILLGNQNYAQQYGDDADRAFWYKIGTTPGLIATKLGDAIKDGDGWSVTRHLARAYPSETTKDLHERFIQTPMEEWLGPSSTSVDSELEKLSKSIEKSRGEGYGTRWNIEKI